MLTQQDVKKNAVPVDAKTVSMLGNGTAFSSRPNSSWSGALLPGKNSSELESLMREKMSVFQNNQNASAENEADRIAGSINSARTPEEVKAAVGEKLGADFSGVRFHTDSTAAAMADGIGAQAYTTGRDVYFGSGGFDSATAAHELVHTVQQSSVDSSVGTVSAPAGGVQMKGGLFSKLFGKKTTPAKQEGSKPDISERMRNVALGGAKGMNMGGVPLKMPSVNDTKPKDTGHQLDMSGMKFGKRAYKKDSDYGSLKALMEAYNGDNSRENENALLDAAYGYVDKFSTGDKAVHKGRTARAEDIISQLTMKGGTKTKADENIARMSSNIGHQKDQFIAKGAEKPKSYDSDKENGKRLLNHFKGIYSDQDSGYSPALQMIVAKVMADQGKTDSLSVGTDSNAKRTWNPGRTGSSYHVNARAQASVNDSDALGTTLHELTHVSVGESYGNTGMFLSAKRGTNKEGLRAERDERVKRLKQLQESSGTMSKNFKKEKSGDVVYGPGFLKDRVDYATGSKLTSQYGPGQKYNLLKELRSTTGGEEPGRNDGMSDIVNRELSSANPTDSLKGSHLNAMRGDLTDIETSIAAFKEEDDRNKIVYDEAMNRKYQLQAERRKLQKDSPQWQEADKKATEAEKEVVRLGANGSHSDTLIEYDPVINQMLMQYEHDTDDRDSKHYRQLKSAALRSHVQRLKNRK